MRRIFLGFCRNWFLMSPLHYLSDRRLPVYKNYHHRLLTLFAILSDLYFLYPTGLPCMCVHNGSPPRPHPCCTLLVCCSWCPIPVFWLKCYGTSRPTVPAIEPLLCAHWPPPPRPLFENIHWINVDLPVGTAPYTIQYNKFMLVKTRNQIWMYRYQLPEINILCLMSYVSYFWGALRYQNSDRLLILYLEAPSPTRAAPQPTPQPPPPPPFSRPTWGWGGEGISGHWTATADSVVSAMDWIVRLGGGGGGEGGWNFIIIMCWSLFWLSHLWVANWPNIWLHNSKGAE